MNNELDIKTLRQECAVGHIKWTAHIFERMQERNIEPSDVINCINNGKIIEQYLEAYPYPACLILGTKVNNTYIHGVRYELLLLQGNTKRRQYITCS